MSEKHSDAAVSEVIAFMLIFAIIVAFLGAWAIFYVPSEGHKAEVQHDEEVLRQFSDIKTGIDLLWTTKNQGTTIERVISLAPTKGTDFSTLLFLYPSLGSGMLKIENGTTFSYYYERYDDATKSYVRDGEEQTVTMLRLSYTSYNEYSNDFSIVYDGGAVFYGDYGGRMSLLESPVIGGKNYYVIALENPLPNDITILGNNAVPIKLKYVGSTELKDIYTQNGAAYITDIITEYPDYWEDVFKKSEIEKISVLTFRLYTGDE